MFAPLTDLGIPPESRGLSLTARLHVKTVAPQMRCDMLLAEPPRLEAAVPPKTMLPSIFELHIMTGLLKRTVGRLMNTDACLFFHYCDGLKSTTSCWGCPDLAAIYSGTGPDRASLTRPGLIISGICFRGRTQKLGNEV